ncbi:OmpA family protein [Luteimonas deserti]|uniref:OmpA family protein n=1 Tax=Luteimonas deserti TaxID=2752306 RepID=A0A7Z0TVS9_9GAMM|nr:OmpA family protein [Luteimonas deserti]NYZ64191.1 OmpA family protein [Luteimonas deserti]
MNPIASPAARAAALLPLLLAACASAPPASEPMPAAPPPPRAFVERLDADGMFAFGASDLSAISAGGRAALDALAATLTSGRPLEVVHVIGHSDRVGAAQANLRLSTRRAESVRDYLVARGVPADRITAVGRGHVEPLADCPDVRGQALIECLAPNRRVEVRVRFAD